MDLVLYTLVSILYPVVIRYLSGTCIVLILLSYVLYSLTGSHPLLTPLLVRYSYGISAVDVRFNRCFVRYMSVNYPSSWYTNGRLPDLNCTSTEQVMDKYQTNKTDWEQTTSGQPSESYPLVVLSDHNFEHTQNSPTDTLEFQTTEEWEITE